MRDSYNLFSTNVILASVAFVYYPDGGQWPSLLINLFTLLGSVFGQLLFGFLADYFGRTRLYGIELVLVIVSTIGVATSSRGVGDLSFLGLFIWWRFVMGIGTRVLVQLRLGDMHLTILLNRNWGRIPTQCSNYIRMVQYAISSYHALECLSYATYWTSLGSVGGIMGITWV